MNNRATSLKAFVSDAMRRAGIAAEMEQNVMKETIHLHVLSALSDARVLERVVFQGGTALRLCYGDGHQIAYDDSSEMVAHIDRTYNLVRMEDCPEEMHITFLENDRPPSGLGEIGNPWIAAAVANGFFQLTGKRLRHMPFTPERVLETLKA